MRTDLSDPNSAKRGNPLPAAKEKEPAEAEEISDADLDKATGGSVGSGDHALNIGQLEDEFD